MFCISPQILASSSVPRSVDLTSKSSSLFVSLVYCAESTVRWFVVREKHCWMAADSADKSKRTGRRFAAPRYRSRQRHLACCGCPGISEPRSVAPRRVSSEPPSGSKDEFTPLKG
jgi:hypothetical protein